MAEIQELGMVNANKQAQVDAVARCAGLSE